MRKAVIQAGAVLMCALILYQAPAAGAHKTLRPEIEAFIDDMVRQHQFKRADLRRMFRQVRSRPAIIRAMSAPATARPWHEFRDRYLDRPHIDGGIAFREQNSSTLARARREFGVPEEFIVAVIGIETLYGRNVGSTRVLDALATLAFDYPPRAGFFTGELEQYLLLAREAGFDTLNVKGSYAGAMGIPQFMPSSYRKYVIDFDGDGKRDLWGDAADAIGSVAHYFQAFGWRPGEPVVVPVDVRDIDVSAQLAAGIRPSLKVGELKRLGIVPAEELRDDEDATLFFVESEDGPQYWLGLWNFYVITRYNRSVNYSMAVYELARALRAAAPGPAGGMGLE